MVEENFDEVVSDIGGEQSCRDDRFLERCKLPSVVGTASISMYKDLNEECRDGKFDDGKVVNYK